MNKAQYLLLAAFIGFYGVLSMFLLARAFVEAIAARMKRMKPVAARTSSRVKVVRRAWTTAVARTNFAPRAIESRRGASALG